MILVTGGTGFVGAALIRYLVTLGKPVRMLLRPSPSSPNLPRGVSVEVAVSSMNDERGLRAAMKGVDVVFHLAGTERKGTRANLAGVDVDGTRMVAETAAAAGVERFFYLSHLGADRASAYAVLKAKAIGEGLITHSGVNYTIIRSSAVFGPGDQFTTSLAALLRRAPGIFFMPGDGRALVQPLWIEDLVTCMGLCLDDPSTNRQLYQIGGSETFTIRQVVEILLETMGIKRRIFNMSPAYLRILALLIEQFFPQFPVSIYWLDYLAADRTCPLNSLPRLFGLMPARFRQQLDYLTPSPPRVLRSK
jgi:NADH dehydrogenase